MSMENVTRNTIFSERLKLLRKTQKKAVFAVFLGTSPQNYGRYEAGRIPDAATLERIANRCGVSIDYLLGRDSAPNSAGSATLHESGPHWDTTARKKAAPNMDAIPEPERRCLYPVACDLPGRLDKLERNLADINTLLVSLLAEERSRNAPAASPDVKAG